MSIVLYAHLHINEEHTCITHGINKSHAGSVSMSDDFKIRQTSTNTDNRYVVLNE